MKGLKLFLLGTAMLSAAQISAQNMTLNWNANIYWESRWVNFDYNFGGSTIDIHFYKKHTNYPLNPIESITSITQYSVTGTGTMTINIPELWQPGYQDHYDVWIIAVEGLVPVDTIYIPSITPFHEPSLSVSDEPVPLGGATRFIVGVTEYGTGGSGEIATLWFYITDLNTGVTTTLSETLAGTGTFTQEHFDLVLDQSHDYEYCAELTYEDAGLAPLWGPCLRLSSCSDPIFCPSSISTGISEEGETAAAATVYPNPASDRVTITGFGQDETLEIVNTLGEIVRRIDAGMATHQVSDLAAGTYIVRSPASGMFVRFDKL